MGLVLGVFYSPAAVWGKPRSTPRYMCSADVCCTTALRHGTMPLRMRPLALGSLSRQAPPHSAEVRKFADELAQQ